MIVDGHAHVFLAAAQSGRGVDELIPYDREAPVERLLGAMAGAGVDRAVLVGVDRDDGYLATCRREHADRFAAIAVAGHEELGRVAGVDPVEALERRREDFAFDGLRAGWFGDPGRPAAESPALPALRRLAEWGLPLWSYPPPEQLPLLLELPELVEGLTIVLNHLGFFPAAMQVDALGRPAFDQPLVPERVEAVLGLARHPGVVMMISGQYALSAEPYPHPDLDRLIRRSVEAFGAERCLWGSDFPWIESEPGYAETAGLVERALPDLGEAELAAIRGGTALRLFPHLGAAG
jgi:predicted TIM-barrel fold metal-dependent hydrolase